MYNCGVMQAQQRELTVYHSKEHEKESERRLALQKQEYETTIQRHLSFIDQVCVACVCVSVCVVCVRVVWCVCVVWCACSVVCV